MFYAHFVLAKKGPLARIWLAAHWDKKLTKAHVFETNIEKSVDGILQPRVKMALRTSGHLLLGVVRIYSRKAKYLLADCNEAFVKIKMAFRPGMVDLPEGHREAAVNAITLPEVFHDFDTAMPELNDVDIEAQFSLNQSRAEEITMREDYGNLTLVTNDDGFGDMGFDTDAPDLMRHTSLEPSNNLLFSDGIDAVGLDKDREPIPSTSGTQGSAMDVDPPLRDDEFGSNLNPNMISGGLFEGGLFDDAPMGDVPPVDTLPEPAMASTHDDSDDDLDHFGGPPSMGGDSSDNSRPPSPLAVALQDKAIPDHPQTETSSVNNINLNEPTSDQPEEPRVETPLNQSTLIQNDDESFALPPVDATVVRGPKSKRKRKLIVDEVKNISGEEMKNQLSDTTDIVTTLDLAPPTKRLMHWKETGGVEKLFALPARLIPARALFKNYQRHLTSRQIGTEDFAMLGDADSLALDQVREAEEEMPTPATPQPTPSKRGRKRKIEEPVALIQTPTIPTPPRGTPIETPEEALAAMMPTSTPPHIEMPPPATPTPLMGSYVSTPAPPTPLHHIDEMPQLPPDQVHSLLNESEGMGMVPPMTPATGEELMNSGGLGIPATPHHDSFSNVDLENMGYDNMQSIQQGMQNIHQSMDNMQGMHLDSMQMSNMANMGYDENMPAQTPAGGMSERIHSPWQGDYDFPQSVDPSEEQQVDESDEQFEERVLNKRAYQLFTVVKKNFVATDQMVLSEMCHRNSRKQAAQKFYSLLVLKKFNVLNLQQNAAYGEIFITKGSKFENPVM